MLSTENPHQRQLFIVIVHYGATAVTERALAAIEANTVKPTQIVVIDQGPERLALTPPAAFGVPLAVLSSPNAGYGAAANIGMGYLFTRPIAAQDIVLFMNNDVVMEPTTIQSIHEWWHTHPEPALVGVTTVENNQELSGAGDVSLLTGRTMLLLKHSQQPITYIHGAVIMAPYSVWLRVQGWPEKYFLYWEDVLLSQRARQKDIPLRVAPTVKVIHQQTNVTPMPDTQLYYLVRNGALFLTQETSWGWRLWWQMVNWVRLQWHRGRANKPIVIKALQDAQRNITGQMTYEK